MEAPVLSDNTEEWVGWIFKCLENETAADVFLSLTFTSMKEGGMALDDTIASCMRETVVEFEAEFGTGVGSLISGALSDPESEEAKEYGLLGLALINCLPEDLLEDAFDSDTQPERVAPPSESPLWTFSH